MSPRDALQRISAPINDKNEGPPEQKAGVNKPVSCHNPSEVEQLGIEALVSLRVQPRRSVSSPLCWYVAIDFLALFAGYILAWGLAAFANVFLLDRDLLSLVSFDDSLRVSEALALSAGVMLWFMHTGHYRTRMPFWSETQKIIAALGFAMLIDGFFQFVTKQEMSRLWLMSGWGFAALSMIAGRFYARKTMRKRGTWQVRTLLIGSGAVADEARETLAMEPGLGYRIVMQIEDLPAMLKRNGNSWTTMCDRFSADFVLLALDGHEMADAEDAIAMLGREGLPFSVSPPLRNMPVLAMTPQYFFNSDVMLLTPSSGLEQILPRLIKRFTDIAVAGAVLTILSPLYIGLALAIRKDGGPAIFGHKRLGRDGKAFSCFKFRSMVVNGDEVLRAHLKNNPEAAREWEREWKLRDDPRITRIGHFLRRTSLDELPQLLNVLRGDMSLVGPRPIVVAEVCKYHHDISHYYRVRPGLTGLWQVSGRNDVSYAKRVQMDCWYVRNWSVWTDVAILFKTIPVLLSRKGAY